MCVCVCVCTLVTGVCVCVCVCVCTLVTGVCKCGIVMMPVEEYKTTTQTERALIFTLHTTSLKTLENPEKIHNEVVCCYYLSPCLHYASQLWHWSTLC